EPVQVTLSATGGTLTLSSTAGLSFSFVDANGSGTGDGTADGTMTFRGSLSAINTALNGLSYLPAVNGTGPCTITITTNDLGNFGSGGALTDTDSIAVTVAPVNDAPDNAVPGPQSVVQRPPLVFNVANGNRISVSDVDDADNGTSGDEALLVSLSAANGTLTLSGITGLNFTVGDGTA